jgi:AbrB family looped-hinge helix DNA binding protein
MNLAKVSVNGQITIPIEVRRDLGIKRGDNILFIKTNDGEYLIGNASVLAVQDTENVFSIVVEVRGASQNIERRNQISMA